MIGWLAQIRHLKKVRAVFVSPQKRHIPNLRIFAGINKNRCTCKVNGELSQIQEKDSSRFYHQIVARNLIHSKRYDLRTQDQEKIAYILENHNFLRKRRFSNSDPRPISLVAMYSWYIICHYIINYGNKYTFPKNDEGPSKKEGFDTVFLQGFVDSISKSTSGLRSKRWFSGLYTWDWYYWCSKNQAFF